MASLKNRNQDEIYQGLDDILQYYNHEGYTITTIHCDKEFESIMQGVGDELEIELVYAATNNRVPDIKRSNHVVEE